MHPSLIVEDGVFKGTDASFDVWRADAPKVPFPPPSLGRRCPSPPRPQGEPMPALPLRNMLVACATAFTLVACDAGSPMHPVSAISPSAPSLDATASGTSAAPSATTVPLLDPSFEHGYTGGWTYPGTPGQFVDINPNMWQTDDGPGSVDLNGFNPGSVSQSFATFPGVVYTVQFDLAGNPGFPQGVKTLTVSAGSASANYSFSTVGKSVYNMGWTPETFTFTATSTASTLKFQSTYVGNGQFPDAAQGAALDNVRVTWTPTPTTTTVTFGSGPFVYTGNAIVATASAAPADAGTPTITYSGDCTNAGSTCTATATLPANGQYAASSATANITIEKAATTTTASFGDGPFVYDGNAVTATASVSPADAGAATITYSGDCTNAGSTCAATADFAGSDNYLPSSGTTAAITIAKASSTTAVTFGAGPFIYTGSAFTATAAVTPAAAGSATISYSGECTLAGACTATATFAGSSNYTGSNASATITIKYPVAATSAQCKNGGWMHSVDDLGNPFKNQGDCVSFVATKGRNKGNG
jgi:choice-of-anchor C domain-containing protein